VSVAERLSVIRLGDGLKDASSLFLDDPERFSERFEAACASAVPWFEIRDAQTTEATNAVFEMAKVLLNAPDLVQQIEQAITDGGYAGDVSAVMIAYFAITSRQLTRPINIAFLGQSAVGKSESAQAAIELHPSEAVFPDACRL
jgi:hypothetical protein